MGDTQVFVKLCKEQSIEAIANGNELILVCPRLPDQAKQNEILSSLPEGYQAKFEESPRTTTLEGCAMLFYRTGGLKMSAIPEKHNLTIDIQTKEDSPLYDKDCEIWPIVNGLMENDEYIETWKITLNGTEVMSQGNKIIARMIARQTRPVRDRQFTDDELLDLRITLENCKTVDEFINAI